MVAHLENEKDLLCQLRDGYEKAFSNIYHAYSLLIYRRILQMTKIESVAEEITQEVFVRLWEKRALIDPGQQFRAYLFKIAANLVVDFYRKASRDAALKAIISQSMERSSEISGDTLLETEREHIVRQAIETLPDRQRQIFQLCKMEGKSYEEAGIQLGISTATINNQLVKATKSVKYFLTNRPGIEIIVLCAALFF